MMTKLQLSLNSSVWATVSATSFKGNLWKDSTSPSCTWQRHLLERSYSISPYWNDIASSTITLGASCLSSLSYAES